MKMFLQKIGILSLFSQYLRMKSRCYSQTGVTVPTWQSGWLYFMGTRDSQWYVSHTICWNNQLWKPWKKGAFQSTVYCRGEMIQGLNESGLREIEAQIIYCLCVNAGGCRRSEIIFSVGIIFNVFKELGRLPSVQFSRFLPFCLNILGPTRGAV